MLRRSSKGKQPLDYLRPAIHEGVRFQCYAIFAEHTASPEVCHRIPSKTAEHLTLIDGCLSDVALKARNPNNCEAISTPGIRDSCYLKLAKNLGKQALCGKIQDNGLKSVCTSKPVIVEWLKIVFFVKQEARVSCDKKNTSKHQRRTYFILRAVYRGIGNMVFYQGIRNIIPGRSVLGWSSPYCIIFSGTNR